MDTQRQIPYQQNGTEKSLQRLSKYPTKHKNIALLISLFSSPLLSIIVKTFHAVCGNHSNLYSYISHTFASTLLSSFWFVFPRSLNLSPFSLRCWVSFRISGDFFLQESMAVQLILLFLLAASVVAADEGDFLFSIQYTTCFVNLSFISL